jgi:hypothetical protein
LPNESTNPAAATKTLAFIDAQCTGQKISENCPTDITK